MSDIIRCSWCGDDPLYIRYHDEEWGRAIRDDRTLFEFLTLEGAQAGLSWITVLRKRESYRSHFHDWDIFRIALMTDDELEYILSDPGIIRNRLKVYSVRKNAQVAQEIIKEYGNLFAYFSLFGVFPQVNHPETLAHVPAETDISRMISKDLKKRGMSFVGSTIIYAFMQAVGMVDDHVNACFRKTSL